MPSKQPQGHDVSHKTCLQVAVTEEAIIRSLVSFRMVYLSCRKPSYPDWVVFSTRMPFTPAQQTLQVRPDKLDCRREAASGPDLMGLSAPGCVGDREASRNVFLACRHAATQHARHICPSTVQLWAWRGSNPDWQGSGAHVLSTLHNGVSALKGGSRWRDWTV